MQNIVQNVKFMPHVTDLRKARLAPIHRGSLLLAEQQGFCFTSDESLLAKQGEHCSTNCLSVFPSLRTFFHGKNYLGAGPHSGPFSYGFGMATRGEPSTWFPRA